MISCVISQTFLLALSTYTWQSGSLRLHYGRDGKDEYRAASPKTGYGGAGYRIYSLYGGLYHYRRMWVQSDEQQTEREAPLHSLTFCDEGVLLDRSPRNKTFEPLQHYTNQWLKRCSLWIFRCNLRSSEATDPCSSWCEIRRYRSLMHRTGTGWS